MARKSKESIVYDWLKEHSEELSSNSFSECMDLLLNENPNIEEAKKRGRPKAIKDLPLSNFNRKEIEIAKRYLSLIFFANGSSLKSIAKTIVTLKDGNLPSLDKLLEEHNPYELSKKEVKNYLLKSVYNIITKCWESVSRSAFFSYESVWREVTDIETEEMRFPQE